MAGQSAQVLTESDEESDALNNDTQGAPGGDTPVLRPVTTPPINRNMRAEEAPLYEAIEVDEEDNAIGDPIVGGAEGNLSQDQAGERPLIDRQQQADGQDRQPRRPRETPAERRARRNASRDRRDRDLQAMRAELEELRAAQNEFRGSVEPRLSEFDTSRVQSEIASLESQIAQQNAAIAEATKQTKKAMTDNDPDAFTAAQEMRENALIAKVRLEGKRDQLTAQAARGASSRQSRQDDSDGQAAPQGQRGNGQDADRRQAPPRQLPAVAQRYKSDFLTNYDWIDTKSRDREVVRYSNRVLFLDNEVAAEGYDPATKEYWDELEDRIRESIPEDFLDAEGGGRDPAPTNNGKQRPANGNGHAAANGRSNGAAQGAQPVNRRGPMTAGAGDRPANGGGNKQQVKITPERKRAMIETGSIDASGRVVDQGKFNRQLAKFAEFDRTQGAG